MSFLDTLEHNPKFDGNNGMKYLSNIAMELLAEGITEKE